MRVWLPIAGCCLLTAAAAWQSRRLAGQRRESMPETYAGPAERPPPALTFILAGLGGFRGIAAEALWFRVNRLQEEGRFLELVQLSDWITRLDPHAADAWIYNAWNLAYNVSILMAREEDRLRWVRNGLTLLRDEALRFNPREARLYRELAWLYQNKIGDSLDSAHLTYKRDLAAALSPHVHPDGTVRITEETRSALAAMRLDADRMRELERRFGPLDWRLAESHAVYWASQGLALATGTERLLCRRAVYQPLLLSVWRGRLTGDPDGPEWRTAPNPALASATAAFLTETLSEHPTATMRNICVRYLAGAIPLLHRHNLTRTAEELYARLTGTLPDGVPKPSFDTVLAGWRPPQE
ncbi:MAG: hypothetical protein RBT78_10685 [Kiritimatiellia bacterium]|jgi:hypothetical protein|nr:hypothetical protein [Kiritimatiellia bacterium]